MLPHLSSWAHWGEISKSGTERPHKNRQNKVWPCSWRRGEVRTPLWSILRHICAPWPSNAVPFGENRSTVNTWLLRTQKTLNTRNKECICVDLLSANLKCWLLRFWAGLELFNLDVMKKCAVWESLIPPHPILNLRGGLIWNCRGTITPTRPTFRRCQLGLGFNTESFGLRRCDCLIKCLAV